MFSILVGFAALPLGAAGPDLSAPTDKVAVTESVGANVETTYAALTQAPNVQRALERIKAQDALTFQDQREITQIPAPSFKEAARADDYLKRFRALGLNDAFLDAEGNVIGRRAGTGKGPTLVLSAHLDTVFPEGTDVTVRERNGRFYAPGLSDDGRGLTVVLTVLRAMSGAKLNTVGDILFVGTVGEEGLGNIRGAKALLRDRKEVDGFISIDGTALSTLTHGATGSRRWKITFRGPGAHSFEGFGTPSATHALGRAVARIADLRPPADPKTTFTIGVVDGGTSVNTIAATASMEIDIRSNRGTALAALEKDILKEIDTAVVEENVRWSSKALVVERTLVGDRPGGRSTPIGSPIVQASLQALATVGAPRPELRTNSTDSNAAMALGIPAVTLRGGGEGGDFHSPREWYRPEKSWLGPQAALLTVLGLVGLEGISAPLLRDRAEKE